MATTDDLQSFLENILLRFNPTIDLSPGSPAQSKIITPILTRLAVDPLDTDIPTFIRDRFVQEFPDLAADGGGDLEDLLTNPLQLILEPFKREIQTTKINQSTRNAALMGDDEADALGRNWFSDRENGQFATTPIRIYFAAPTTVSIDPSKVASTPSGLNYFPISNFQITSAQMLFNRQGSLYFMDITVQAENPGTDYNVIAGEISAIDNVSGVVKVANLSDVVDGAPREDNTAYLGRTENELTEKSMVVKRGISARTFSLFSSSLRALQVVGAGEDGMDRDILEGTSEGFLHMFGKNSIIYGSWAFLQAHYVDLGPNGDLVLQAGDSLRFQGAVGEDILDASVAEVLATDGYNALVLLDRNLGPATLVNFTLFKPGFLTISKIPGGMLPGIVPDDTVHLGGHADIFVRPVADTSLSLVLPNLVDQTPIFAVPGNATTAVEAGAGTNLMQSLTSDPDTDFVAAGVKVDDLVVIENTDIAGTYRILAVGTPDCPSNFALRVDSIFPATRSELRLRIIRSVTVDLVEPKILKLPFDTGVQNADLSLIIGSNLFRLGSTDFASYGVVVGDIVRVLDGVNAGDYTITGFDVILGGQGPLVDKAAIASGAGLRYQVFTKSAGITLPLVRLQTLEILDSTDQGTGITVPYGDAVDIRPTCDLVGAGRAIRVLDQQVVFFPDMQGVWSDSTTSDPAPTYNAATEAQYSQKILTADGFTKLLTFDGANPITKVEVNFPPFLWNGRRDKILALTTRDDPSFRADPTGHHKTSDLAESHIGDSLHLLDGPNQGKYLIKDLRVLDLWGAPGTGTHGRYRVALIQVDTEFPIDPIRTGYQFMGTSPSTISAAVPLMLQYASDFTNNSGFYKPYITALAAAITTFGFSMTSSALQLLFNPLVFSGYEVGPSAMGTLRCYFMDPVSVELYPGETLFQSLLDPSVQAVLDPRLPPAQVLPESETDFPQTQWLRDLSLRYPATSDIFRIGGNYPKQGVKNGDILEIATAVDDVLARKNMGSSFVCVTQAGSTRVQALLPKHPLNPTTITPGQLMFLDSGPDSGAYTVTSVISTDFTASPPNIIFTVDRALGFSTLPFPTGGAGDPLPFPAGNAIIAAVGNPAAMLLDGTIITFKTSTDGGLTFTSHSHTFGGGNPWTAVSVAASLNGVFGAFYVFVASGNDLRVKAIPINSEAVLVVDPASTAIGAGKLQFAAGDIGRGDSVIAAAGTKKVYGLPAALGGTTGQWISIYSAQSDAILTAGEDVAYLGSYLITATGIEAGGIYLNFKFLTLDRTANFPATASLRYVIHAAPASTPSETTGGGRLLSDQFVRFRLYSNITKRVSLTIPWSASPSPIDPASEQQLTVSSSFAGNSYGHKDPYRILRPGVRRISSTAMAKYREGALYYFDVPVIAIGPGPEMNLAESLGLKIAGPSTIDGYRLSVADTVFSYSILEKVNVVLPGSLLPVGSSPDLESRINLAGQNLQILYQQAPLVRDLQAFVDSPLDRVVSASLLVRHFLPSYVFLDVSYVGGSAEDIVATDLTDYINNIPTSTNQLRADIVQDKVKLRGASQVTLPITLIALTHGGDRQIRGMRSQDALGGSDLPAFEGTFKQTFFIAGPDTSLATVRPDGEQIFLKKS